MIRFAYRSDEQADHDVQLNSTAIGEYFETGM